MKIETMVRTVRYFELDEIKFYEDQRGYWIGHVNGQRKRLHIYVWEKYNGTIPKGYHVHHIDHNTDNNEIENLELIDAHEHLRMHGQEESSKARARELLRKNDIARERAAAYHRTEKNREWARENWKTSIGALCQQQISKICEVCGKPFTCNAIRPDTKYCSGACKSMARRKSGMDDVTRNCIICGTEYRTNKYLPAMTCGKECLRIYQTEKARERNGKNNKD